MRSKHVVLLMLVMPVMLGVPLAISGCAMSDSSESFSDSSGSISDSVGSISDSSTSSSGDDSAYREDVRGYTVAHLHGGGTPESLRLGLSEVTLARGVSDWEAVPATFVAIGAGLAGAGVPRSELGDYQHALATAGSSNALAIAWGFDEAIDGTGPESERP